MISGHFEPNGKEGSFVVSGKFLRASVAVITVLVILTSVVSFVSGVRNDVDHLTATVSTLNSNQKDIAITSVETKTLLDSIDKRLSRIELRLDVEDGKHD